MFPFRTSSIFRSRWMALLWAAGIIWTAVDFAGTQSEGAGDADGNAGDAVAARQAELLMKQIGG